MWFCRHLIRKSIEFYFFARFRYNFDENVFYIYFYARIICFICEIAKFDIRIYNNIHINHYIKTLEFSIFHIRKRIYSNEKRIISMFFHSVTKLDSKRFRNRCSEIFNNRFIFHEFYICKNMRTRREINCHIFVFFAEIIDFFYNIKKFCNKYECIFAIRFIQKFAFLDYDIRNHVRVCEKYIKFVYRNRKSCKDFREINREYSNSDCSHSRKTKSRMFKFQKTNIEFCIKVDEKIVVSTDCLRSNNLQTLQTEFQF